MVQPPRRSTLFPYTTLFRSGVVALDYFAYDRSTGKLWVPASNTGSVDVIDENSDAVSRVRSEEHTSELQSHSDLVCRLLLEKKKNTGSTDPELVAHED